MWCSYGNEHPAHLLHPQVMALREEYQPAHNASSPGQSDDNASSSPFLPKVPTSTCRPCEPPFNGPLRQTSTNTGNLRDLRVSMYYSIGILGTLERAFVRRSINFGISAFFVCNLFSWYFNSDIHFFCWDCSCGGGRKTSEDLISAVLPWGHNLAENGRSQDEKPKKIATPKNMLSRKINSFLYSWLNY